MPAAVPAIAITIFAAFAADPAWAYIGPGAGLSMLAAFWALLTAVLASIGFLILQPVLRRIRRRNAAKLETQRKGLESRRHSARVDEAPRNRVVRP